MDSGFIAPTVDNSTQFLGELMSQLPDHAQNARAFSVSSSDLFKYASYDIPKSVVCLQDGLDGFLAFVGYGVNPPSFDMLAFY